MNEVDDGGVIVTNGAFVDMERDGGLWNVKNEGFLFLFSNPRGG